MNREKLLISGTEGQLLVVYHAQPGTSSGDQLALLGSMAATPTVPADNAPTTRDRAVT